jgi:hypothetical protein
VFHSAFVSLHCLIYSDRYTGIDGKKKEESERRGIEPGQERQNQIGYDRCEQTRKETDHQSFSGGSDGIRGNIDLATWPQKYSICLIV